jgi:hypothetical protein
MRTLKEVLSETLLLTAKPAVPIEPVAEGETFAALDLQSDNDKRTEKGLSGKGPFDPSAPGPWSFKFALEANGPRVSELHSLAPCPGMAPMAARVCDEISWRGISVRFAGRTIDLPLTAPHLLAHSVLREEGKLAAGANRFFALEAAINFGVQLVFAYEMRGGELRPFSKRVREKGDFTDFVDAPGPGAGAAYVRVGGGTCKGSPVAGLPPRFLVCISFTAHKPRNDFEPQGVLLAGRMVPAVFVRANCELEEVRATVRVVRPAKTSMAGMMTDVDDAMGSVFFTDRNNAGKAPVWSEIFDYYLLPNAPEFEGNATSADPFVGVHAIRGGAPKFKSVRRLDSHRRTESGIMPTPHVGAPDDIDGEPAGYPDTAIVKTAGQGEFDSIHVAPKMVVQDGGLKGLKVAMAPICAHDCLHTHWRWSYAYGFANHTRGYDSAGTSYQKAGAPLVPQNQDVHVVPLAANGFDYSVVCRGPIAAREWQAAMTHGSAYALAVMTDSASHKGLAAGAAIVGFPWLYAILRYAPTTLYVPSLKAAAEAAALANTNPLLALLILIADQKAKIKRADLVERVKFSAADLEIMRKW